MLHLAYCVTEQRPSRTGYRVPFLTLVLLGPVLGCGGATEDAGQGFQGSLEEEATLSLGPLDGHELPPTDLDRVAVGSLAPDFSLESLSGDTVTLSAFRGSKNVVLVFYRGHW